MGCDSLLAGAAAAAAGATFSLSAVAELWLLLWRLLSCDGSSSSSSSSAAARLVPREEALAGERTGDMERVAFAGVSADVVAVAAAAGRGHVSGSFAASDVDGRRA